MSKRRASAGESFSDLVAKDAKLRASVVAAQARLRAMAEIIKREAPKLREIDEKWRRQWEAQFGQPPPTTIEEFEEWAVRIGWSADFVRQGKWTPRKLMPQLEGYIKRLNDALAMEGKRRGPDADVEPPCYVTLQQMADMVQKTKSTIERRKKSGVLPPPDIKGGPGKADEWLWSSVRQILADEFNRPTLPARYPAAPFAER